MTDANKTNAMMMIVSPAGVETPTKKRFSGLLKNTTTSNTEEKEKDMLPLDVSLHSVNTEISNMTEITTITTVSQRDKEMDRAMAQLEYATTTNMSEEQQHPVNALLHSFQHDGLGRPSMDTIPRPAPTLQDRLSFFARNVGLAAAAATPPDAPAAAAGEPRRNGLAQFFQDRVDTFSRNMETIGSVWKRQHQRANWQPQQNTIQEEKKEDDEDEEESQEQQTPDVLLLEMEHPPTTSLDDVSSIVQRKRQSTQEQ